MISEFETYKRPEINYTNYILPLYYTCCDRNTPWYLLWYNNSNNNIQHLYSAPEYFTLKRCCENYKIDSDFFKSGVHISLNMSSVYQVHI